MKKQESQLDRFKQAAHELETDQSEEAFDRVLKKIAKVPRQPEIKPPKRKSKD